MFKPAQDFTSFVPPHTGSRVLPNTPFLSQLLRHTQYPTRLAIRDANFDPPLERTYADLLLDAVTLREALRERLPKGVRARLERQAGGRKGAESDDVGQVDTVFVGVLAPGGYEYVVAVLAVWALGACVVPMTTALPVEEALYFVRKSRQSAILMAESASQLGNAIVQRLRKSSPSGIPATDNTDTDSDDIVSVPIQPNLRHQGTATVQSLVMSSTYTPPASAPGIIIFTSGTTGPPKGAVLPNSYISEASRSIADFYALAPSDILLHLLPVHHVTGLAINILPFLTAGACVESRNVGGFDAKWVWQRWRDGYTGKGGRCRPRLTVFSAVPTVFVRMMRYFQRFAERLPVEEQKGYRDAARGFRCMMCGTSALPAPVQAFWRDMVGKSVLTRYGSTEAGAVIGVSYLDGSAGEIPEGAAGTIVPGMELRLDGVESGKDGDGEILVKSPHLFSGYLDDFHATKVAFDEQGFFKTGDIARRDGPYYHILGRASIDIIKSGGYKISALDIEREILALPYINEVVVVAVQDEEFGQRVGAIVTLREDQRQYALKMLDNESDDRKENQEARTLTLDALRDDLRARLASYKMPTLLRVMPGELPKTASGKVLKKVLGPEGFPVPGWEQDGRVMAWKARSAKL